MDPLLDNLLFLDIETVPGQREYASLPERMKKQWDKKSTFFRSDEERTPAEWYEDRAGIFAEFGKVVAISMGYFTYSDNQLKFRVLSLSGTVERQLLADFKNRISKFPDTLRLCAHNGKEFDYPYLCRRLLINGLSLPDVLNIGGKKPWEVNLLDTMELWKFGDFKNFTSLDLLASVFDVESSKGDIDGSEVSTVYYEQNDLKRIAEYCSRDVVVTAQVFLRLHQRDALPASDIIFV